MVCPDGVRLVDPSCSTITILSSGSGRMGQSSDLREIEVAGQDQETFEEVVAAENQPDLGGDVLAVGVGAFVEAAPSVRMPGHGRRQREPGTTRAIQIDRNQLDAPPRPLRMGGGQVCSSA